VVVEILVQTRGKDPLDWLSLQETPGSRRAYWQMTIRSYGWRPATDVYETEAAYVVRSEVAGMSEDDFSITLQGRLLRIQGVRNDRVEARAFYQMEIPFGEFVVEIELPGPVDAAQATAAYQNGFLQVVLPKVRPTRIEMNP